MEWIWAITRQSLKLRVDEQNRLFIDDSLVFQPTAEFANCFYELAGKNYIVATSLDSSLLNSPIIYMLGKRKVRIYKIVNGIRSWDYDLKGARLLDISDGQIVVENDKGKKKYIRLRN